MKPCVKPLPRGFRAPRAWQLMIVLAGALITQDASAADTAPYESTYRAPAGSFAIKGATILTAEGPKIENGTILVVNGRIAQIGVGVAVPEGIHIIDGRGKWVTPGIIDMHSHMGALSSPAVAATQSPVNELSSPNTAEVWVQHSLRADDPNFARARESGVTAVQILPGSGNVFGGRSVVLKNVAAVTIEDMIMPGAPQGLKMACGENPPRAYGVMQRFRAPMTPMEAFAIARIAFTKAADYRRKWDAYEQQKAKGKAGEAPARDLQLDTLAGVLRGEIRVHIHCYRADQMMQMVELSHEFGFKIAAFHHASEAYQIAGLLAKERIGVASWGASSGGGGGKIESYNAIPENGGFVTKAGGLFAVHSDSELQVQHLNSDAGRLMAVSNNMGWATTPADAIRWLTLNPAMLIGIDRETGSLATGKSGDVVLWNRNPFSIYSLAEKVFIDGALVFDRASPQPDSNFSLGLYRRN